MKVLVSDPISPKGVEILREEGFLVEERGDRDITDLIGDFDGVIVRSATKITEEVMAAAGNLKVIGRAGIGLDNIDLEAAKKRGIEVLNTPGATSPSVAELAIAMLLAISRNLVKGTMGLKEGKWEKKKLKGRELCGLRLGILGIGGIGSELASKAQALGMDVLGYRRHPTGKESAKVVGLDELLETSDVVSIHLPLTNETRHMISYKEFDKMKDGAILINCARGGIVDEKALYDNLKSGKLYGAGIDVYETEPPGNNPLFTLDNVVLTPHIGGQTTEGQDRCGVEIVRSVVEALRGG